VLVPLGSRTLTAIVVGVAEGPEPEGVRDVLEVLDREPFLPEPVLNLALWIAEYYMASPGDALGAAAPPFAWIESEPHFALTPQGRTEADGVRGAVDPLLGRLGVGPKRLRTLLRANEPRAAVESQLRALEREGLVIRDRKSVV